MNAGKRRDGPAAATDSAQRAAVPSGIQRIIVFSRYPQPGQTKTRLIPALGAVGAAQIQAALTHHTLQTVNRHSALSGCEIEVRFTGCDAALMQQQFGAGPHYRPQCGGDLGARLRDAVRAASAEGVAKLLLIGIDCPELTPTILAQAWTALDGCDVVLGPAHDGGYYLLGMTAPHLSLLEHISWGTEHVDRQTTQRAAALGLRLHRLPPLADIDLPEDLIVCRRLGAPLATALPEPQPGLISVVIPTLNESPTIESLVRALHCDQDLEVIVADGGSCDDTIELAERAGACVVSSSAGRGRQMNAGAAVARGEILLFVHADVQLPPNFANLVRQELADGAVAGAFALQLDASSWGLRLVQWGANLRTRLLQLPYGDQGIFLAAEQFFRMGGFRNWPLMEDFDFCRRLAKLGRIACAPAAVTASARRWQQRGVLRTTLINQGCVAGYFLGVPPERLARWYRRKPDSPPR